MNLKILLPFKVFAEITRVSRIIVETRSGSHELFPRRLDCAMTLIPGILTYAVDGEEDIYIAVDEGVLVKTGPDVLVSVRNAVAGKELGLLREAVEQEFLATDEQEVAAKAALARVEGDLIQRFAKLRHGK